jgi:hypothetical protein
LEIKKIKGKELDLVGRNLGFERKRGFLFKENDGRFKARIISGLKNIPYNGKPLWEELTREWREKND